MDEPICVRCYDDCYWIRGDSGDYYTPPSSECGKDDKAFEDLNIEPCYGERDETERPDCPFYINYDRIVQMESEYHIGEPVTKGENLRAMSDEALATHFKDIECPYVFGYDGACTCGMEEDGGGCYKCWLDWLQSPAGGDGNE